MSRGKDICNELKAVRRRIAEENGIELEIPECHHQGPCPGTCPRCEQEVRILERELAKRIKMGKVATVAGLALALGAPAAVQAQQETEPSRPEVRKPQQKLYPVQGTIIDAKTKEPLPFCNVTVLPMEDKARLTTPKVATTDFDGIFKMELPEGNYTMRIAFVGYKPIEKQLKVTAKNDTIDVGMEMTATVLGEAQVIICGMDYNPIIEIDNNATNTEVQGVPLRVQY